MTRTSDDGKVGTAFRMRTWVERRQGGWYLVVGFWQDGGHPEADESDSLAVGPFESYEVANAHLTGTFRDIIFETAERYAREHGGWIASQSILGASPTAM